MNAREELRKAIGLVYTYPKHQKKVLDVELAEDIIDVILAKLPEMGFVKLKDVDIDKEEIKWIIKGTAKILKELGYVRLKDVEIDEEKVRQTIQPVKTQPWLNKGDGKEYYFADIAGIIKAIVEAKPIRVKEVK